MAESNFDKRLKEMLNLENSAFESDDDFEFNEKDRDFDSKSDKTKKKPQSKESAKFYVAALCSRSEYCIFDIKEKLRKKQLPQDEIDEIIEFLLKEKYIDETRYCRSFINDKYKYAKWGKIKIAYMLKSKKIPNDLIYNSMDENIDEEVYLENLEKALTDKRKSVKGSDKYEIKSKLFRFASGRGYESDDISKILNKIL